MALTRRAHTELTPHEILRWTRIGMLAALAMLLGYLETFIPIPIPGVKLGLANIAILIALAQGDIGGALGIALIKVLAAGLLFGSPVTMAYSAVGTLCAFGLMAPLSRIPSMHVIALSVVGAVAHELGQLFVAMLLLGTPLVWYSAPVLLVAGCVTGALCGLVASSTVTLLQRGEDGAAHAQQLWQDASSLDMADGLSLAGHGDTARSPILSGRVALIGFAVYCVCALRATTIRALEACLAAAALGCVVGRVRLRDALRALRPLLPIVLITLVAQVLSVQHGSVLCTLGSIRITREALIAGATLLVRLLALTLASLAVMRLSSLESLIEAVAWLLAPLRRLGLRVDGFVLALQSALRFLPTLAALLSDNATSLRAKLGTRELWTTTLPQLIAQLYREAGVREP